MRTWNASQIGLLLESQLDPTEFSDGCYALEDLCDACRDAMRINYEAIEAAAKEAAEEARGEDAA